MLARGRIASHERAKRLYFNTVQFGEKEARRLLAPGAHAFAVKALPPYSVEAMNDDRQRVVKVFADAPLLCALVQTRPADYRGLEGMPVPHATPNSHYTSFGRYVVKVEVPGLYEALNEDSELNAVYHVLHLVFDLLKGCRPARTWGKDMFSTTRTVLARQSNSCASWANLSVSLLRSLRIPARLVYGGIRRMEGWNSHAWVEVEFGGRWVPFDPVNVRGGYAVGADYIKLLACVDWGDVDFAAYKRFIQRTNWWPPFEITKTE